MSAIDKLAESIRRTAGKSVQTQIRLVECVSVDWGEKTMIAKGMADEVDYLDVSLGFGAIYTRPAKGSVCLVGIIDGQEVASFLLQAGEVEQIEINANNVMFNGGDNKGLVKVKELTEGLNAIQRDLNALKQTVSTWAPIPQDGGASLKAAITPWAGQTIAVTAQADIEDAKITH